MSGGKPLASPCDLIYRYDGGLEGFYCCVYDSVYLRQLPLDILPYWAAQGSLLPDRHVQTDRGHAERVRAAVSGKISIRARELIETVFLSCMEHRELALLRFLLMAFREGSRVINRMDHPDVQPLLKAERHLFGEAHLLKGFLRFSDVDGRLIATIRPKNFILPFLAEHFIDRYSQEDFMIFDRVHKAALMYQNGHAEIVQLEEIEEIEVSDDEARYRALWKQFYNTLAIEARFNPKCRMSHMPKRYWSEMVEMRGLL